MGPELKIFNELLLGDSVTVRITKSVVVALRPNAKTTVVEDKTAAAKKGESAEAADVLQQLKATVTVESVDAATGMITYKGADNRSVMRMVSDRRLIDGLKRGDTIEVTYNRERAIGSNDRIPDRLSRDPQTCRSNPAASCAMSRLRTEPAGCAGFPG